MTSQIEWVMHGFKSIPVALVADVILPGSTQSDYRKEREETTWPQVGSATCRTARSTRVTSKEAPQIYNASYPLNSADRVLRIWRSWDRVCRRTKRAAALAAALL